MQEHSKFRFRWLYVMLFLYVAAGINHFLNTNGYVSIMPHYLPDKVTLVYISGAFEILFGLLLIPPKSRKIAAWGIIFLLIAVFPANIQMAIDYHKNDNLYFWIALLRLPLQLILIRWAWVYTKRIKPVV